MLRRMGSEAPTLPRISYMSCFDLTHAPVATAARAAATWPVSMSTRPVSTEALRTQWLRFLFRRVPMHCREGHEILVTGLLVHLFVVIKAASFCFG